MTQTSASAHTPVHFIRLGDVEPRIQDAWNASRPFSLVRVGDGELSVLTYPDMCDEQRIQYVFRRAMKDRHYTDDEIALVRSALIDAVNAADVVGIFDSYEANDACLVYQEHIDYAGIGGVTACNPQVHIYLQSVGALDRLIRRAGRITLITGRDVLQRFRSTYPHADVDQLLVPVERQYELVEDRDRFTEEHFPAVYDRIRDSLSVDGAHHLFLVGAGLLGKAYCATVKARGGFALDIGSVFDYWMQVPTREGKRVIESGQLVVDGGESRWPGMFLGSIPDPVALERSKFRGMFRPMEIRLRPN